jgi:hypothetical protein
VTSSPIIAADTVVQTAGDNIRGPIVIDATTSDFFTINAIATTPLAAQLARPRLATSSLKVSFTASFTTSNLVSLRFRVLVDGIELAANGIPLLSRTIDPLLLQQVEISNIIPPSILGEARAHQVFVQVSMSGGSASAPPRVTFDPSQNDGASVVIQEIAG